VNVINDAWIRENAWIRDNAWIRENKLKSFFEISLKMVQVLIQLKDGTIYSGQSFGAHKSISGECVFQTGTFLKC
jgi:hypothetical protein